MLFAAEDVFEPGEILRPEARNERACFVRLCGSQVQALLCQLIFSGNTETLQFLIGIGAEGCKLLLGTEETDKGIGRIASDDRSEERKVIP